MAVRRRDIMCFLHGSSCRNRRAYIPSTVGCDTFIISLSSDSMSCIRILCGCVSCSVGTLTYFHQYERYKSTQYNFNALTGVFDTIDSNVAIEQQIVIMFSAFYDNGAYYYSEFMGGICSNAKKTFIVCSSLCIRRTQPKSHRFE